jgi:3-oxoacyl-[acyl-carrier-protein] synthase-1
MIIRRWIRLTDSSVTLNGKEIRENSCGHELLTHLYREWINDYPKFFKMDALSRLGFIVTEILLHDEQQRFQPRDDRAVVFIGRSGSLADDTNYQKTIADKDNYFPSPSVFVYTLPNIVTGEVAIRNKYYGETCFHVIDDFHADVITDIISDAFQNSGTSSVIGGWLECSDEEHFEALLFIVDDSTDEQALEWNKETITEIINNN